MQSILGMPDPVIKRGESKVLQPPYPEEFPSFAIGIPTLNRWDLLRPTLWLYLQDFPSTEIYIIDNGSQQKEIRHPNVFYKDEPKNIGVAASWNYLCETIFKKHPFALILNDDIYLGRSRYEIGNLIHFQRGNFFISPLDWCAFIAPKKTYEKVGPFDQRFRAYDEDKDYERRLRLFGGGFTRWDMLSPKLYRNNSTSDKLPEVLEWARESRQYYIEKWGGPPGQEKYLSPFNGKK